MVLAMTVVACGQQSVVTAPTGGVASASALSSPPPPPPTPDCPAVPLTLVVHTPTGETRPVLTLDAKGTVAVAMMGPPKTIAKLDTRGCLVSDDGVEVDVTRSGALWTHHERIAFTNGALRLDGGRSMRIEPNGDLATFARDGSREPDTYGSFTFTGYGPPGACAARVLLVTFMTMMPSMAVSDGHPRKLPQPEDSACPELPH